MYRHFMGFGIAGNIAGHLEQAGEAADFAEVQALAAAPKAIFPVYRPGHAGTLGEYPFACDTLRLPVHWQPADRVQIEPEVVLHCRLVYDEQHHVTAIEPQAFAAYNDCSIRRPHAKKISEKKNWGKASKGISAQWLPLSHFTSGCELDNYHLSCFLERNGRYESYGERSAVIEYSYFHQRLLDWLVATANTQTDSGPMESISQHLQQANYPQDCLVSIGATRYTPLGETTFLQPDDVSWVVLAPAHYSQDTILTWLQSGIAPADVSLLGQRVQRGD